MKSLHAQSQRRPALKTGEMRQRTLALRANSSSVDTGNRVARMSFSSEEPVDMWYGTEILSHAPGAMRQGKRQASMPLLFNHNRDDLLGIVESVELGTDRRGYAQVRFGTDELGAWALQQVADGVLVNVSFLYRVFDYDEDEGSDTIIATDWEPYEISLVTVPADASVGVGRSLSITKGRYTMSNMQDDTNLSRGQRRRARITAEDQQLAESVERSRCVEIAAMCRHHGGTALADTLISEGYSIDEARGAVLEEMIRRNRPSPIPMGPEIGMNSSEAGQFSIVRAINAVLSGDWQKAGLERAASRAIAQSLGRDPAMGAFFVPMEVLSRSSPYQVGAPGTGGAIVATNLLPESFIEVLRAKTRILELGATILPGLVGNVDIPRRSSAATAYWVAESGPLTEMEGAFDKISLTPKTVGALNKMSRNMLLQSTPDIEMLIRADLAAILAQAIDRAAISGNGSGNQPVGILNTNGLGSVVGGTNGASLTFDHMISLHATVMKANADRGSLAYLVNPATIEWLSKVKATTGQYLWPRNSAAQNFTGAGAVQRATAGGNVGDFDLFGFPIAGTNLVPSNLTKGSSSGICSAVIFGNFNDIIIGQWGALEIIANPFDSTGFTTGDVMIRAMQTIDIGIRQGASFAVMADALLQ